MSTATLLRATLIADPFNANANVDECCRRVQNETLGHRGRMGNPLFRSRRLHTMAERHPDDVKEEFLGLVHAGDPRGEVQATWHAKDAVRELYAHADEETVTQWSDALRDDVADTLWPTEVRSGRSIKNWRSESSPCSSATP